MSEYDEENNLWFYPISAILFKPQFLGMMWEVIGNYYPHHEDVRQSKRLGWKCELCGSKSKPKARYKHTLIQRVKWHINGRCPAENNMNFYAPREHIERVKVNE